MRQKQSIVNKIFSNFDRQLKQDLLLFFLIPSVFLVSIFLFPQSESALEYKARNPTLVGVIGSNLAHRSWLHISRNIGGYWLLGGTAYLLMKRSNAAHIYRYAFVSYLLILPFFASWTILYKFSDRPDIISQYESVGFSLTVGAVTGFLAIAIAYYHSELADGNYVFETSLGLFTLGFSLAFFSLGVVNNSVIVLLLFGFLSLPYMVYRLAESLETLLDPNVLHLVAALAFFGAGLLSLFPPSAPPGIHAHMAGYVWGYVLPLGGIFVTKMFRGVRSRMLEGTAFTE